MKKEAQFYLISFAVLGLVAFLHALEIIDPFKQLPAPNWIFLVVGLMLGMLLQKGLKKMD